MKKFRVYFESTVQGWDEIEAESAEEALRIAEEDGFYDLYGEETVDGPSPTHAEEIT